MSRYQTLRGTRDILPAEIGRWQRLESIARATVESYGFREIRTPMIESTELFARSVGSSTDIVRKEMYTFTMGDDSGRSAVSMTLRPEMTAPVVRAFIEGGLDRVAGSDRLYYIGAMFRHERPQKGRQRQFHQLGVEVIGQDDPATDAETIEMVLALLEVLGVTGTTLVLNSVGDGTCRPRYREALAAFLATRLGRMCEDCRRRAVENPMRVFDCKNEGCRKEIDSAPTMLDSLCEPCAAHFKGVREALDGYGIAYRLDPRLVRGLDYYVRTAFEVVSGDLGAQSALMGGGRYDGLVAELGGRDLPGFGWAMGLERLVMLLPEEVSSGGAVPAALDVFVAPMGEAARRPAALAARAIRRDGRRVLLESSGKSLQSHLRRADKLGARWVLIIGEAEAASGSFLLREMKSGGQTVVAAADVVRAIERLDRERP